MIECEKCKYPIAGGVFCFPCQVEYDGVPVLVIQDTNGKIIMWRSSVDEATAKIDGIGTWAEMPAVHFAEIVRRNRSAIPVSRESDLIRINDKPSMDTSLSIVLPKAVRGK
jgi:hypothetical protein